MSDVQSALTGAEFTGLIDIADAGAVGMITLRGESDTIGGEVSGVLGLSAPEPRRIVSGKEHRLAWLSPDEMLVTCAYDQAPLLVGRLQGALKDVHALVVDTSDARAVFNLEGNEIRDVLSKLCPVDLDEGKFPVGEFRRTRLAQVPVAFWFESQTRAHLICFRSVAHYVLDALSGAATQGSGARGQANV